MNEPNPNFNLRVARRLEDTRLSTLLEEAAMQREADLNALLRGFAAQGKANSGGRLQREMDIIFASTESLIEKAIAYRKELATKVPALLLAFPHLKEFHARLDEYIDGAVLALRTRHLKYPAGAGDAAMGASVRRASALKAKVKREIQALSLEGTLGMHRGEEPKVTNLNISNIFHNINVQGSVVGAVNTGQVQQIDVAVDHIKLGGDAALARSLAEFAEALLADTELHENDKKEVLEQLSFLTTQTVAPKEQRKPGMVRSVMEEVAKAVSVSTALVTLWEKLHPLLSHVLRP
jgi:hypothetical protein